MKHDKLTLLLSHLDAQWRFGLEDGGDSASAPLFGDIMVSAWALRCHCTALLGVLARCLLLTPTSPPLPLQVVAAQGFAALQFILEEKFLGTFRMQVSH